MLGLPLPSYLMCTYNRIPFIVEFSFPASGLVGTLSSVSYCHFQVVGHSLGGGTAALLTYILREQKEFSSSTCVTFAPGMNI